MSATSLTWLPSSTDLPKRIAALRAEAAPFEQWITLAQTDLNFVRTDMLNKALTETFPTPPTNGLLAPPFRLAILGSSTTKHLHAGIRIAALRRGLWVDLYEPEYGQYFADLIDPASALHRFNPTAILFAFDARHITRGLAPNQPDDAAAQTIDDALNHLTTCWQSARQSFDGLIIQQTILPVFPTLMGENEQQLPGSPAAAIQRINARLPTFASNSGVSLLAIDQHAARHGIAAWHSETFWHQAKQDIVPTAAPLYGDLLARLLAAAAGRSAKCAVLDLDNTLWGGVIGDDGLDGITLGQGSAEGEAFLAFQSYLKNLAARGIILAVCSKNDEANALAAFDRHPEMLLRRTDIACFVANWQDKAANLRHIAQQLNIGLDSLVFIDDNPFERNLVRSALPMVAVPELPEEPALMAQCIADAGYFESLALTDEDRARSTQYQANAARAALAASTTDMPSYLRSLDMRLLWSPFDTTGVARITQLINKTNQFNLTTRRYLEADIRAMLDNPAVVGLQLRLTDRFGDNGIIAIVILHLPPDSQTTRTATIDTWLMSCRVLGRQVEQATLAILATIARQHGATHLRGQFIPTAKNAMVALHYENLGFRSIPGMEDHLFELDLSEYKEQDLPLHVLEMVLEPA
ncbi:MAG: HAD-IIIC family phosphatase [Proteobacteria bacterium]|nr:HAD-IIIC family phosphatase [Pseudomonadota bacterium]